MHKLNFLISILIIASIFGCKNNNEKNNNTFYPAKMVIQTSPKHENVKKIDKGKETKSSNCKCINGIGSAKNDKPIISKTFSNGTTIGLCGFVDSEVQGQGLIMSEFNLINCKTGEELIEIGALQVCRIEEKKDTLSIIELKKLPVGKNWNWEWIQIAKQDIVLQDGKVIVNPFIPKIEKFEINKENQNQFIKSLKKGKGFGKNWEIEISKLEALSLIGNDRAWTILKNYENFTGEQADGAIAEQWKSAKTTVEWILNHMQK